MKHPKPRRRHSLSACERSVGSYWGPGSALACYYQCFGGKQSRGELPAKSLDQAGRIPAAAAVALYIGVKLIDQSSQRQACIQLARGT